MTTIDAFAARLDRAARQIEREGEKVTEKYGDVIANVIDELAPRRADGDIPSAEQVRIGVVQPKDSLVGLVVGSAANPPRSDRFLRDSLDEVEPDFLRDVGELAADLLKR